jgi:hypothetical protein
LSDFHQNFWSEDITHHKKLILELYNHPNDIDRSILKQIDTFKNIITKAVIKYKHIQTTYRENIEYAISPTDRHIITRNYQQVLLEAKFINERCLGFEIRRIAHNIKGFGYSDEAIEYMQTITDNAEALQIHNLDEQIYIIQNYIDEQRKLKY